MNNVNTMPPNISTQNPLFLITTKIIVTGFYSMQPVESIFYQTDDEMKNFPMGMMATQSESLNLYMNPGDFEVPLIFNYG